MLLSCKPVTIVAIINELDNAAIVAAQKNQTQYVIQMKFKRSPSTLWQLEKIPSQEILPDLVPADSLSVCTYRKVKTPSEKLQQSLYRDLL